MRMHTYENHRALWTPTHSSSLSQWGFWYTCMVNAAPETSATLEARDCHLISQRRDDIMDCRMYVLGISRSMHPALWHNAHTFLTGTRIQLPRVKTVSKHSNSFSGNTVAFSRHKKLSGKKPRWFYSKPKANTLADKISTLWGHWLFPLHRAHKPTVNSSGIKVPRPYLCSHWVFRMSLTLTSMARKDDAMILKNLSLFSWRTFWIGSVKGTWSCRHYCKRPSPVLERHLLSIDGKDLSMQRLSASSLSAKNFSGSNLNGKLGSWISVSRYYIQYITQRTWQNLQKRVSSHGVISLLDGIHKGWILSMY